MKTILSFIMLLVLSGCIVFPLPGGSGSGLHYGHSNHSHGKGSYASTTGSHYPWWSMDYFYLGAGYGRPWYGYYSPYFYPHYFSVWRSPWNWPGDSRYGSYYAWRDPYWHDRYRQFDDAVYPEQPAPGPGPSAGDFLGQSSRIHNAEPLETGETALRTTSFSSPGVIGAMTVVSPYDGKVRSSTIGPTRGTGLNARVDPSGRSAFSSSRSPSTGHRSSGRSTGSMSRSMTVERHRSPSVGSTQDRD